MQMTRVCQGGELTPRAYLYSVHVHDVLFFSDLVCFKLNNVHFKICCTQLEDVTVIDKVHTCTNRTSSLRGRTRGVFVLKQQCEEVVLTICT